MFPKQAIASILKMAEDDQQLLEKVSSEKNLSDTYHPELKLLHNQNSDNLRKIVLAYGWPKTSEVGEKVAKAAWLILQHGIERPKFMQEVLKLAKSDHSLDFDQADIARLEDRISFFAGKPQIYGTNFDWNETGELVPTPITNPDQVDKLRKSVGLPPLKNDIVRMQNTKEKPPANWRQKQLQTKKWAKQIGWR